MPKLKVGDIFTVTQEMLDYEKKNIPGGHSHPKVGGRVLVAGVEACTGLKGVHYVLENKDCLHSDSVDKFLHGGPEWEKVIAFSSKSGFKIEKDKITFPNGEQSTFQDFTKKYNAMRQVCRKLSAVKKEFNL